MRNSWAAGWRMASQGRGSFQGFVHLWSVMWASEAVGECVECGGAAWWQWRDADWSRTEGLIRLFTNPPALLSQSSLHSFHGHAPHGQCHLGPCHADSDPSARLSWLAVQRLVGMELLDGFH